MSTPVCKGCGCSIIWRKTPPGRFLAVDPGRITVRLVSTVAATDEERATGRRRTLVLADCSVRVGIEAHRGDEVTGHEAHWASCSAADQFRREKGGGRNG